MTRKLTTQEKQLWQKITNGVSNKGIENKPKPTEVFSLGTGTLPLRAKVSKPSPALSRSHLLKLKQGFSAPVYPPVEVQKTQAQNPPLERNIRQKLQRGRADIQATLDLHGYTRITAHPRLIGFLQSSYQQGLKTVIVITGKGDGSISRHTLHSADFYSMPEQTSVLRSLIADWLNSDEAQNYIIGWQPAHPKHGGGGAVYVRIRNKNKRNY